MNKKTITVGIIILCLGFFGYLAITNKKKSITPTIPSDTANKNTTSSTTTTPTQTPTPTQVAPAPAPAPKIGLFHGNTYYGTMIYGKNIGVGIMPLVAQGTYQSSTNSLIANIIDSQYQDFVNAATRVNSNYTLPSIQEVNVGAIHSYQVSIPLQAMQELYDMNGNLVYGVQANAL